MNTPIAEENKYSFRAFVLSKGFLSYHFKVSFEKIEGLSAFINVNSLASFTIA
ncbi:hypothetical protein HMPREF0539_0442 [Lacticaseibacillus rhamnosus LMS2-1]|jgi:hypothetical protein|uniref:Uncharacterized protein n=1 Tax=Lacticaseibacillus rhamnosus (strain LMS2-1) TaxID=525361 RepID=C2JU58_LACRM|nr:hypothetical protein HMPREF0539_0442 [Lacticaseibacillus rhamnosus LMS2-1]